LVADIGLRKPEQKLPAEVAEIRLQAQSLAQAKEIVRLVIDSQEGTGLAADAAVHTYRVLALFLYLQQEAHGAVVGVLDGFGILVHLQRVEILQLVEPVQAVLP